MANLDYLDMYLKAQENLDAKYYVVCFDLKNSKEIEFSERFILQEKLFCLIKYVYLRLSEIEILDKKKILIDDKRFCRGWDNKVNERGDFFDPIVFGDAVMFTVLRDSISRDQIISLFYDGCKFLDISNEFHVSDGYYETNEYLEGDKKLFRGYCLSILSSLHKKDVKNEIKEISEKR